MYISMGWSNKLESPHCYEDDGKQPKIAPEVQAWREELARAIRIVVLEGQAQELIQAPQVIVDISPLWPNWITKRYDIAAFLPSILAGVEMGLGIDRSRLIPFIHEGIAVGPEAAGFGIYLYPAEFAGHKLSGTIGTLGGRKTIIILERVFDPSWIGTRVEINMGVIRASLFRLAGGDPNERKAA